MNVLVFLLLGVAFVVVFARPEEVKYIEIEDSTIEEILGSERLLKNYIECFKGLRKCPPDGQKVKDVLPEVLRDGCSKCNDKQIQQGRRVLDFILANKKDTFLELEKLYDPDRIYRTKYAKDLDGLVLPD